MDLMNRSTPCVPPGVASFSGVGYTSSQLTRWAPLALSLLLSFGTGCTATVVRSSPPVAPTSAIEMAGDTERLDVLITAVSFRKDEIKRMRDITARAADGLRNRSSRDQGLEQFALRRTELALELYDKLLVLSETKVESRSERAELAGKVQAAQREYFRAVMGLEQNVELLPLTPDAILPQDGAQVREELLPPPPTARLLAAWNAGRYEQVTREVEGAGHDVTTRMPPHSVAVYALSLGSLHRYEEAAEVARSISTQSLVPEEALELRYRQGLWLLKLGKRDEAVQLLKSLSQEAVLTSRRLDDLRPRLSATFEDLGRGSTRFQEQIIDARLALVEKRWEDGRNICRSLLEKETTVEAVNRTEALLRQIEAGEERAFRAELDEVTALASVDLQTARDTLEKVAIRYPALRFQPRIVQLRTELDARWQKLMGDAAPTPPEGASAKVPEVKPGEPSPTAGKPAESKPAESKPAESKPAQAKPAETKPAESKPAEAKPAQAKPAETKPAETKPAESKPAESKPAETKPAESKPAETKPAETKPVDARVASAAEPAAAVQSAPEPLDPTSAQKRLEEARALVKAAKLDEALPLFDQLQGSVMENTAKQERQKAIDVHVQKVRERVARDYVSSAQLSSPEKLKRLTALLEELRVTLEKYPTTGLKAKVESNMKVLEGELKVLQP